MSAAVIVYYRSSSCGDGIQGIDSASGTTIGSEVNSRFMVTGAIDVVEWWIGFYFPVLDINCQLG